MVQTMHLMSCQPGNYAAYDVDVINYFFQTDRDHILAHLFLTWPVDTKCQQARLGGVFAQVANGT